MPKWRGALSTISPVAKYIHPAQERDTILVVTAQGLECASLPCLQIHVLTHRACPQTVLIFLALLTSALQNVVHRLNHKKEVERVQRFMLLARKAAWGPKLVKNNGSRKVRVNIAGNPYIDGEEQEYVQGRMIDMLVQGNEVYLVCTLPPKPPSAAHRASRILRPRTTSGVHANGF